MSSPPAAPFAKARASALKTTVENANNPAGYCAGACAAGVVPSGTSCTVSKLRHTCEPASCSLGNWSNPSPACIPDKCYFDNLTIVDSGGAVVTTYPIPSAPLPGYSPNGKCTMCNDPSSFLQTTDFHGDETFAIYGSFQNGGDVYMGCLWYCVARHAIACTYMCECLLTTDFW